MSPRQILSSLVVLLPLVLNSPALSITGRWVLLPASPVPGSSERHDDMAFIDDKHGWVVNGDGDIYSTINGGETWTHLADTGVYNRCVAFTDSLHGFVGHLYQNSGSPLSVTVNGGTTWTQVSLPSPVPHGLCGMWAASGRVVYGVGAYYGTPTLIKTINNGATWTTRDMSNWCGALVDCYFWDPDSGIAVGSTTPGSTRLPLILLTTDGGYSWSVRWTGTRTREICWKISFVSHSVGFVSIENLAGSGAVYFLKTTDGGLNWQENLFSPTYLNCQGIGFIDEETGWIGGWSFKTQLTLDGGGSWQEAGFGYDINRFRFLSPTMGYACGDRIYKWTPATSAVAEIPQSARPHLLEQNSPNPFDRETRIHYRVEEAGPVTLQLFDLQGREIRTLVDGMKSPGSYSVVVGAGSLPAGVYAYRLTTRTGTETRKMWLVR
jgi:photosystem II stability/assembly factor-like uncharacterized protein